MVPNHALCQLSYAPPAEIELVNDAREFQKQANGDRREKSQPDQLPKPAVRSLVGIAVAQSAVDSHLTMIITLFDAALAAAAARS